MAFYEYFCTCGKKIKASHEMKFCAEICNELPESECDQGGFVMKTENAIKYKNLEELVKDSKKYVPPKSREEILERIDRHTEELKNVTEEWEQENAKKHDDILSDVLSNFNEDKDV